MTVRPLLASLTLAFGLITHPVVAQTGDVPVVTDTWINAGDDQRSMIQSVGVRFDRNVVNLVTQESLKVRNIETGALVDLSSATLVYDPRNNSANWMIDRDTGALLTDGNYIAWIEIDTLLTPLQRDLKAAAGEPIDDFTFGFHQFVGDSDGDRDVDFRDASVLRETWQRNIADGSYKSFLDRDLSNRVDENDRGGVEVAYFTILPPAPGIHLFLRNDTGEDPSDNVTGFYAAAFDSVDTDDAVSWQARLGNGAPFDITALVAHGAAALDTATIDQLNGTPLAPGNYSLTVDALDADGATIASDTLPFEFTGVTNFSPRFVTEPPPGVALGQVEAAEPLNLATWSVERWDGSQGPASWVVAPDGLSVEQTVNAAPSALISDQSFLNLRVTGTFRVDTSGDDDFMGFIFGYQNRGQFYVFDWKQNSQSSFGGSGLRGMSIRRFDSPTDELTRSDFWISDKNTPRMTVLSPPNDIGWKDFQDYQITLEFTPGRIVVEVFEEGVSLDRLEVMDDTFTGGRFGFYNYSQDSVIYSGFSQESLNNVYFYDAEAVDPEGGAVTYSLPAAPAGATVDPVNGSVIWQPDTAGTFPFTLVATDAGGLTDTQNFDVVVSPIDEPPTVNIAKTAPSVLPGEEISFNVTGADDQQLFRVRFFVDGLEVPLDGPNGGGFGGVFTTSFSDIGLVELEAIAIDSAQQVTSQTSYVRVLDPEAVPEDEPPSTPVPPGGQVTGGATDLRPMVGFDAPLTTADDPTVFVGTVDAAGGTLRRWLLEWAPLSRVDTTNLASPAVLWQVVAEGTNEFSSDPVATIVPSDFPDEEIVFRLRAENDNGLGSIASLVFNPQSQAPSTATEDVGTGPGIRPSAAFTAPTGPGDDPTQLRGTVSANGGTLTDWTVEYAPSRLADLADLTAAGVPWSLLARDTTELTDGLLATLVPASLPDEPLVFRLTARNDGGLGSVAGIVFNPSSTSLAGPGGTTGADPATGNRPVTRIASPRNPGDDRTNLVGSVLANGGTLDNWIVDYALLGDVNPNDLQDPGVTWTTLASGDAEIDNAAIVALDDPAFQAGRWVIRLRAFNTNGLGSLASTTLDTGDTSSPNVAFTSPQSETDITFLTEIRGSIDSGGGVVDSWTLEYASTNQVGLANLNATADWTEIASGTGAGTDILLGTFDPTNLRNGSYVLRLRAFNTNGRGTADGMILYVCGQTKLGNFQIEFEDLNVPVSDIPIRVVRTYDSLDTARSSDFGPGWSLSIAEADISETVPDTGDSFLFATPFEIGTRVFLTNPRGERIGFTFNVRNPRNRFLYVDYEPYFIPDPGVEETLSIAPSDFQRVEVDAAGAVYTPLYPIGYNPDRYRLTTTDGTTYEYDQRQGLQRILDRNGNQITFTRNGITHSDGTSVSFTRDGSGRITTITDPAGGEIHYEYDVQGRLRFVTDRTGGTTEFVYGSLARPNFITEIIDPRGISAVRSEYDDEGRLIRQIDPRGGVVEHAYDPAGMTQVTTDRLGNVTTREFNELGAITRTVDRTGGVTLLDYFPGTTRERFITDPVGNVTSKAYDAAGKLTALTLGADTGEDPSAPSTGSTTRFTYGPGNELTAITDANGNVNEADYDPATGELVRFTTAANDGGGDPVAFSYEPGGDVRTVTDPAGNVTTYTYLRPGDAGFDDGGLTGVARVVETVLRNPSNVVLRMVRTLENVNRDTLRRIAVRSLPGGGTEEIVTDYAYDGEGQPVLITRPNGRIEQFRYNEVGELTAVLKWRNHTDFDTGNEALAQVTSYTYDVAGNLVQTIHPDGTTTSATYDAENRKTSETDEAGRVTRYEYDAEGRLRFTIHPDGTPGDDADNPRVELRYDAAGQQTDMIDERGDRTEYRYNALGLETERIVHLAGGGTLVTQFGYDADGTPISITDPRGLLTEITTDTRNRPVEIKHPATVQHGATSSRTEYDNLGRKEREIDEEGRGKLFSYDGLGRLIRVERLDAGGTPLTDGRVTYTYDEEGNRTSQTDAEGHTTRFEYDAMGRRTATILPNGDRETMVYDAFDNLVEHTDFAGFTTTFTYDDRNRVTSIVADPTHPSLALAHAPAHITLTYFPDGQVDTRSIFNAVGTALHMESFTYDERGRRTLKTTSTGTLTYTHFDDNLVETVRSDAPNGLDVAYAYDAAGRLTTLTDLRSATGGATYDYDANGNLLETRYGNGTRHRYTYDARNRLIDLRVEDSGGTLYQGFAYTLNPRGDRNRVEQADGRVHTYTYDDLYRLTREEISGGVGNLDYALDRNGNRTSRTSTVAGLPSQAFTYDSNNRLAGDTYDGNGNTVTSTRVPPLSQGTDTYDFRNRLIRRTQPGGKTIDFLYDADGIRIRKVVDDGSGAVVRNFLIDDMTPGGHPEVVEERDDADNLLVTHVHGHDLISSRDSGTEHLFLYDGSGSVVGVTNASETLLQSYSYDAFGNLLGSSAGLLTHYLYRGEQYDPDLGLYYLRARYANPGTGRFWTMDRFMGFLEDSLSLHRYLYASANPVTYSDPSGYFSIAGISVSFQISINLRKVQANHIHKATKVIAKRMLKTAAILARHYLDYRGFTRFNLPGGITFFAPIGIDYNLTGAGRLGADLLYVQSIAMVKGAFAARLVSVVAGFFKIGISSVTKGVKFKAGKFTVTLANVISVVSAIGTTIGNAISEAANRFRIVRFIRKLRSIYEVFQSMKSVAETAAEFAPLAQMAFDYWQINRHAARGGG